MNIKIIIMSLVLSNHVFADSSIECKILGGSEQALTVAPKEFSLSESGDLSLFVGKEERLSIEVGKHDTDYYPTQDIRIRVGAKKSLLSAGSSFVQGIEIFTVQGCANEETTSATYVFEYKQSKKTRTVGSALYTCTCALD